MRTSRLRAGFSLTIGLIGLLFAPGCNEDSFGRPTATGQVQGGKRNVSEFPLEDMNPNSPSFGQMLTPGQQQGRISAWYFGAAT